MEQKSKFSASLRCLLNSKKFIYSILGLWLCLQVFYIYTYWAAAPSSDGSFYIRLAQISLENGELYPNIYVLDFSYFFSPAYINLLILTHKIFGAFHYVVLFNLVFNIVLLWVSYVLAKKMFSREIANIFLVLFCLTFTNFTSPIAILGDLAFTTLAMLSLFLATREKLCSLILAGVLVGLANWVRPLCVIFAFTSIVYMLTNKYSWKCYALYISAILITVGTIGFCAKQKIGSFIYASNTSGVNLAMTANKYATGTVNFQFTEDEFYADLTSKTYENKAIEADKELRDRAVSWIRENPFSYIKLLPKKLILLYSIDSWAERSIKGNGYAELMKNSTTSQKLSLISIAVLKSSVYYIILLLFLLYLWQSKRAIFTKENIFLLVPILGTAITIAFVAVDRYHSPYIPIITIYAAAALGRVLRKE